MIPAPFVASAETKPRSIRSIRIGPSPVLMTWAPNPQMMPRAPVRADRIAATTALKSAPARMAGNDARSDAIPPPARYGFAKSAAFALLVRDASGYVRTPDRSKSSYGNFTRMRIAHNRGSRLAVRGSRLKDQHCVSVAVEAIPL